MKRKIGFSILLFLLLGMWSSCEKKAPLAQFAYEKNPQFVWGYAQFYGNYYANYDIPSNVLSLHLFTEGLTVQEGKLIGKGQYLVLSDVFIQPTDTLLPIGAYTTSDKGEPMTYFGGKSFKVNRENLPTGAYLNYLTSHVINNKTAIFTSSAVTVQLKNDSLYIISIEGLIDEKTPIKGTFEGVLPHIDQSVKPISHRKLPLFNIK